MSGDLFGPLLSDHGATFRLFAPAAKRVDLVSDTAMPMQRDGGWFNLTLPDVKAGARYQFRIDGDVTIPDPGSRFQPDDVQGASEVIDQHYAWKNPDWKGRPWTETVFLELHVGTFTPEGTYRAAIGKLDHLVETGITALEIMPLSDFPGRWNWGYDGVLPFAPDNAYGRPEDLKALIDAAHGRGLMVFLDVVYNHFGPEGNYLGRVAPQFFSDQQTPWGGAINYDLAEARALTIENAVYWLRDYRFDGLRLDAVHAIVSPGTPHILHDLSTAVGRLASATSRHIHLVLENDDNRTSLLAPFDDPAQGRYRAQWNDDYHHAWHVLLAEENAGYYKDYDETEKHVIRSLAEGFCYQGEPSSHRQGQKRGEPSSELPPAAFVNFLQNHDQIGNRAKGERLSVLVSPEAIEAALVILLLSPAQPLLFMGEEWGATEPFPFFCDFKGDLADAVRNGRKAEFADAYAASGDDIPDPLAQTTFRMATLDWSAIEQPQHARRLSLTRDVLRVRHRHIVPMLPQLISGASQASFEDGMLRVRWRGARHSLALLANLSDADLRRPANNSNGENRDNDTWIWGGPPPDLMPRWSVFAALGTS